MRYVILARTQYSFRSVEINATFANKGWCALGFSTDQFMPSSDIAWFQVDAQVSFVFSDGVFYSSRNKCLLPAERYVDQA
jgi:hypothetical protein